MPIRECTRHFGGRRTGNRVLDVLASGSACRCCDCATSAGTAMPIRPSKPWLGATPISACLDRHRAEWRCTSPSSPPLRGHSQPAVRPEGCRAPLRVGGGPVGRPLGHRAVRRRPRKDGTRSSQVYNGLPAKDRWSRSDLPQRVGMACTSQPSPVARQASKAGGRSGHGLRFRRGAAAPEAVV